MTTASVMVNLNNDVKAVCFRHLNLFRCNKDMVQRPHLMVSTPTKSLSNTTQLTITCSKSAIETLKMM